jgi:hypothetical protein
MHRVISALLLALLFTACGRSVDIITDYDPEADFTTYQSFFFLPWNKENSSLVNEFDQKRLILAVTNEMESRGYKRVESGGDLAIGLNVLLDKKTAQRAYTSYYSGGGWGYYAPYGFGVSTTRYENYDYLVGTLIIDLFDARQKKLVWQGSAIGTVDKNRSSSGDRINSVVEQLFWEYPVDPK